MGLDTGDFYLDIQKKIYFKKLLDYSRIKYRETYVKMIGRRFLGNHIPK